MDKENTKSSKKVKEMLNNSFKEEINIFETIIPRSIKVAEATIYKKTICEYLPTNIVAKAYEKLVNEVLQIE